MSSLRDELSAVLNRHSVENASNTPDFILATFLIDSLNSFARATRWRERHYGREVKSAVPLQVPNPPADHPVMGELTALSQAHELEVEELKRQVHERDTLLRRAHSMMRLMHSDEDVQEWVAEHMAYRNANPYRDSVPTAVTTSFSEKE